MTVMNWFDYLIVGVIALSAIIGFLRGFVREIVAVGVWVAAILVAWLYHPIAAERLSQWITEPSIRLVAGAVILVLGVLTIGAFIGFLLAKLVEKTGFSGTDRMLGVIFGGARGAVLVAMVVFLAALTPIAEDSWWQESQLVGRFRVLGDMIVEMVPPEITEKVRAL